MDDSYVNDSKIKFYSIDGKLIDDFRLEKKPLDDQKEIKTSKEFNSALKAVTQKDINVLKNKLVDTVKDIKKNLAMNNTFISDDINDDIENIDKTITDVEALISDLIIKKSSIKIGIFSSNKKEKKAKIRGLEASINYLSKAQNDIIFLKNEYNKLIDRSNSISGLQTDEKDNKEEFKEDPLERTINFYMNKN